MKLPSFNRINRADYPQEYQSLVDQLAFPINIGIESVYQALVNRLTIKDNLSATVRDVTFQVDSNGLPKENVNVKLDVLGNVGSVLVGRIQNLTNTNTYPSSGVVVSFTQLQNIIRIDHVTGLQANNNYKLRLIILND